MKRRRGNGVAQLRRGEVVQTLSRNSRGIAMEQQRGVSIISAILLVVFLTTIGAFVVSVGQVQGVSAGLDVAGMRANHAALAGLEWGKYQVLIPAAPNCPAAQPLVLPNTMASFRVTVTCTVNGPYTEGASLIRVYQLTATACNQPAAGVCPNPANPPGDGYVERQVSGWVQR